MNDRTSGADPTGAARALATLDVRAHLADPARKQAFVTPMFDVIAPRYDDFTRRFSFGMDARWKDVALAETFAAFARYPCDGARAPQLLDLACGTGDLAIGAVRRARAAGQPLEAIGVDAAFAMVQHARARLAAGDADVAHAVRVVHGDMMALALPDASVDGITAGYAVRNVPDPHVALAEAARVLRPGGTWISLDFYRPTFAPWRAAFLAYLRVAGDLVGWTWHRSPVVYGYIARSIDHFMSWQQFSAALEAHGFAVQRVTRWLGGGVAMHVARRLPRAHE